MIEIGCVKEIESGNTENAKNCYLTEKAEQETERLELEQQIKDLENKLEAKEQQTNDAVSEYNSCKTEEKYGLCIILILIIALVVVIKLKNKKVEESKTF